MLFKTLLTRPLRELVFTLGLMLVGLSGTANAAATDDEGVWDWEWENTALNGTQWVVEGGQAWAYYGISAIDYPLVQGVGRVFGIALLASSRVAVHGQFKAYSKPRTGSACTFVERDLLHRCANFEESYTGGDVYMGYNVGSVARPWIVSLGAIYSNAVNATQVNNTTHLSTSLYTRLYSSKHFGAALALDGALDVWSASLVLEVGNFAP